MFKLGGALSHVQVEGGYGVRVMFKSKGGEGGCHVQTGDSVSHVQAEGGSE